MSREYCDHILDLLSPLRGVSARAMFGGYGLYRSGLMFAIIVDDALYFKVTDLNRADFEAAGSEAFQYQSKGKAVTLSYWNAPPEALDDESTLLDWAEKSCRAARENRDSKAKKRPVAKKSSKTKR